MAKKTLVLFPDVLDQAYQISWIPEAVIPYPYVYRFFIRDNETGELITPNDSVNFWAEFPRQDSSSYNDEDRSLNTTDTLSISINIKNLLFREQNDATLFLLSAHLYNTEEEILAEREQSVYLKIIKNGLKPPSLP